MIGNFEKWADYNALQFFKAKDYVRITTANSYKSGWDSDLSDRSGAKRAAAEGDAVEDSLDIPEEKGGVKKNNNQQGNNNEKPQATTLQGRLK